MAFTPSENVTASILMPGQAVAITFSADGLQRLIEIGTAARGRTLTAAQAREAAALFTEAEAAAQHAASSAGVKLDMGEPLPHFDAAELADYTVTSAAYAASDGTLTARQARDARYLFEGAVQHLDGHADWKRVGERVFRLRERWLATGSRSDREAFDRASADYHSRFSDCPPGATSCRTTFDAQKRTDTCCSCPPRGNCTCQFTPVPKETMTNESDFARGQRDAEAALRRHADSKLETLDHHRALQEAQSRRARAPLSTTVRAALSSAHFDDSHDVSPPRPPRFCQPCNEQRAAELTECPVCGSQLVERPETRTRSTHGLRSLAGLPGVLSKESRGPFDGFGPAQRGGHDPEAA